MVEPRGQYIRLPPDAGVLLGKSARSEDDQNVAVAMKVRMSV